MTGDQQWPVAFEVDAPVPFRTVLFRIAAQELTGREATPAEPLSALEEP
ncbi:MAG TPA: hypothetical protein VFR37_15770 [Longimicrobium sp.]|nr:hypothetical protein [Longimicrobium sp.]